MRKETSLSCLWDKVEPWPPGGIVGGFKRVESERIQTHTPEEALRRERNRHTSVEGSVTVGVWAKLWGGGHRRRHHHHRCFLKMRKKDAKRRRFRTQRSFVVHAMYCYGRWKHLPGFLKPIDTTQPHRDRHHLLHHPCTDRAGAERHNKHSIKCFIKQKKQTRQKVSFRRKELEGPPPTLSDRYPLPFLVERGFRFSRKNGHGNGLLLYLVTDCSVRQISSEQKSEQLFTVSKVFRVERHATQRFERSTVGRFHTTNEPSLARSQPGGAVAHATWPRGRKNSFLLPTALPSALARVHRASTIS